MNLERLYYASNVLKDGRVFLVGGEYSGPSGTNNWINSGEIYDPVTNGWTNIPNFPQSKFGDDPSQLLPDGRVLVGYLSGPQTYIFDPASSSWSSAADKLRGDRSDEETWIKLPDDSILTYEVFTQGATTGHAQRYIPSTNTWVDAGTVPALLSSSGVGFELGPAFLLPDGRAWFAGATGHTAFYTPSTNSWTAGPDIPNGLGADDAPGAELPNGKILLAADTPLFHGPTRLFEFDPTTNTYTDVTPSSSILGTSGPSFVERMLVLPTGQVLVTAGGSSLVLYTPDGSPDASWMPTISSVVDNGEGTYTLTGTQLNGISQGASYGDDAEMDTNYPLVRLVDASGHVSYARTSNWSSTGVATGSTPMSTRFTLPAGFQPGSYSLSVVASGIASDPFNFSTSRSTSTSLVSSPNPSTYGQDVTFTATVAPSSGTETPTGDVQFFAGTTSLGTMALSGGTASITVSSLTGGHHSITAHYSGDTTFSASTSASLDQMVNRATTAFSNLSAPTIIIGTATTTLSGKITAGPLIPNGSIAITLNGVTQNATIQGDGTFSSGFATASLGAGSYTITYSYAGDTNFTDTYANQTLKVTYDVNVQFDQSKPKQSGSTIPIKLQATGAGGVDLSSSGLKVKGVGYATASNPDTIIGLPLDVGNSNLGGLFRFDPTTGSYIFNLKTTGFASGVYLVYFTIGVDPIRHSVQVVIR